MLVSDMLVKLYALPDIAPVLAALAQAGIEIRPAHPSEKYIISDWVKRHFKPDWGIACENALVASPVTCYLAVEKSKDFAPTSNPYDLPPEKLVGFACYDVAAKNIFGPTGVSEDYRGRGIGTGLLLACLDAMHRAGYAYAIIGQVGPIDFYVKMVGATLIEGSEPGMMWGRLIE